MDQVRVHREVPLFQDMWPPGYAESLFLGLSVAGHEEVLRMKLGFLTPRSLP